MAEEEIRRFVYRNNTNNENQASDTSPFLMLDHNDEEEDDSAVVDEEIVSEVMQWLEREIRCATPIPLEAIAGNHESCGPAISDTGATLMASVDTRTGRSGTLSYFYGVPPGPMVPMVASGAVDVMEKGDDEEWLARVLGETAVEIEERLL